jgi:lysophospholipase L1-like esterase
VKSLFSAVLVLALSGFVCGPAGASERTAPVLAGAAQPVRVMELGDSITAGVVGSEADARGGYRAALATLLMVHDYRVTFVGSRTDYSTGMSMPEHEGWPGYVIRSYPSAPTGQLYGALTARALRTQRPDVVLLMVGTNDLLRLQQHKAGYTQAAIAYNMDLLLHQIFTIEPDVGVLVAGVVESPRLAQGTVEHYDLVTLPSLVSKYSREGYRISFVAAMEASVPRDRAHFPDGLHPYGDGGYALMANAWYAAINPWLARFETGPHAAKRVARSSS